MTRPIIQQGTAPYHHHHHHHHSKSPRLRARALQEHATPSTTPNTTPTTPKRRRKRYDALILAAVVFTIPLTFPAVCAVVLCACYWKAIKAWYRRSIREPYEHAARLWRTLSSTIRLTLLASTLRTSSAGKFEVEVQASTSTSVSLPPARPYSPEVHVGGPNYEPPPSPEVHTVPLPQVISVPKPAPAPASSRRRPPPLHLFPRKLSTVPEEDPNTSLEACSPPPIPSILVSLWDEPAHARTPSPRRDSFHFTQPNFYTDTPVKRFRRLHYPGSVKNTYLSVPKRAMAGC